VFNCVSKALAVGGNAVGKGVELRNESRTTKRDYQWRHLRLKRPEKASGGRSIPSLFGEDKKRMGI